MKILLFADLHTFYKNDLSKIVDDYDICFFLGDIKSSTLKYIITNIKEVPIYAVLGNHDDKNVIISVNTYLQELKTYEMYQGYSLENINLKKYEYQEITFTGIEGSEKYKYNQPGYTQEESLQLNVPKADILFAHDTGWNYMDDNRKIGLKGINQYIKNRQPKYHIFGHFHTNINFIEENTFCYCIYGCSIFDTEKNIIKNIF